MESVKREPVMKLEAERLWGGAGEYAISFEKAGWLEECRRTGGTFLLYTQPDWADFDRVTAEREALQLLLNERDEQNHSLEQRRYAEQQAREAAERRAGELSAHNQLVRKLLGQAKANLKPGGRLAKAIEAALNPTAEAVSYEP